MTDIEITKLCAGAMGMEVSDEWVSNGGGLVYYTGGMAGAMRRVYNPLHDDAQAMALVKELGLDIIWLNGGLKWRVYAFSQEEKTQTVDYDLNRAICETVAKMQKAKA